ncbi:MAG: inositol monophosphatase family protein [Cyanobacteria bacterium CRU_2_1]|nr:inositol monophosphatase family protein [Cyanobacteria bacterium RU_5_0]NJR59010.1 inositol monophosphatase family protein [Cyanobacteria bacterium CRU_2_1]
MTFSPAQLQKIQDLIRHCGQQAERMASDEFQVFEKGKNDFVTSVDRALDQQLTAGFSSLFPSDGVITEENAQSWQAFGEEYDRLWLIDPLDGTNDFIHRKPHYSVMVGLLTAYEPIAGWVYAPAFDQLYFGGSDLGLFQSIANATPVPLTAAPPAPPSETFCPMIISYKDRKRFGEAISQLIPEAQFDCIGSFGLKVMRVIRGQAGLYVYLNRRVKLWDTTGPVALAKAAGLICCDLNGDPLKFTPDAVDTTTLAHQQPIVIGWAEYVEALRSRLQEAVAITPH